MESKIGIIIQARKGSTRLPGKVVMPFYQSLSILEIILDRITERYPKTRVVLATTTSDLDDEVAEIGSKKGVHVFRGSEENVLDRFVKVVREFNFEGVIRVCADNPFLDVDSFEGFINQYQETGADYVSFGVSEDHPTIKTHFGFWAEFVSGSALKHASSLTQEKLYIEHVTNYIYGNPEVFKVNIKLLPDDWIAEKNIRFTLDTPEDFNLLQNIYTEFVKSGEKMSPSNLISYVKSDPEIEKYMATEVARWEK